MNLTRMHRQAGIAHLTLARPETRNAFNAEMIAELQAHLLALSSDASLRLLILDADGEHFSAGADLAWMQASSKLDPEANRHDAGTLSAMIDTLYRLPCPVLAVVQGSVMGGAIGMVAACDIVLAAADSRWALSELRLGLAPAIIAPYVMAAVGARAFTQLALSARRFSAQEALNHGLVHAVHAREQLATALQAQVASLLQTAPQASRTAKALIRRLHPGPSAADRQQCIEVIAQLRTAAEAQEGLEAFFQRRTPAWGTICANS